MGRVHVAVATSLAAASAAFMFWKFVVQERQADCSEDNDEEEEEEAARDAEPEQASVLTNGSSTDSAYVVPDWLSRLEPMNSSGLARVTSSEPPKKNARGRYKSVSSDAADLAQAILLDKISDQYSPAENAAHLLQDLLTKNVGMNAVDRATILYAVRVLQSDSVEASIPEALQRSRSTAWKRRVSFFSQAGGLPHHEDMEHEMAHEWLRSDFTPLGDKHSGTGSHHASYSSERWNKLRQQNRSFSFQHPHGAAHPQLLHSELLRMQSEHLPPHHGHEALPPPIESPSPSPELNRVFSPLPYEAPPEVTAQIMAALEGVNEWGWDVFKLREVTKGKELQTLGWHLMHSWGVVEAFAIDAATLCRWLSYVESKYDDLPYHNYVLQTVHFMLETAEVRMYLEGMEVFAILVAAMVHDMGHDGCNNAYHKNAVTPRALQFNDQSIQENFHLSTLFSAMKGEDASINIFQGFSAEEYVEMRRMIISMVLATDMSRHFVLTKEFKELAENHGSNVDSWNECHDQLMCTVLHACDISNPAKPLALAKTWASRCMGEFFRQGDLELAAGLSISPQCNRHTTFVPTSQTAFIKFVVLPTMEAMGDFLPEVASTCLPTIHQNLLFWQELEVSQLGPHKDKLALLTHSPRSTPRTPSRTCTSSAPESLLLHSDYAVGSSRSASGYLPEQDLPDGVDRGKAAHDDSMQDAPARGTELQEQQEDEEAE